MDWRKCIEIDAYKHLVVVSSHFTDLFDLNSIWTIWTILMRYANFAYVRMYTFCIDLWMWAVCVSMRYMQLERIEWRTIGWFRMR